MSNERKLKPGPHITPRLFRPIKADDPSEQDEIDKFNASMPEHLQKAIFEWLDGNGLIVSDVRWGSFPLGMVQRWIERAESAEKNV